MFPRASHQAELARIKELLKEHPFGLSITEISERLGRTKNTVGRYLDILKASGQVEVRSVGMAKIFSLAKRVPVSHAIALLPVPVMVVAKDLSILHINQGLLDLLGIAEEHAKRKTLVSLKLARDEAKVLVEHIVEAIEKGIQFEEIRLPGERVSVMGLKLLPLVFDDGTEGYAIALMDLTAAKKEEEALRERERHYREIVEEMETIVLKAALDGRITYMNRYGSALLGDQVNIKGLLRKGGLDERGLLDSLCRETQQTIHFVSECTDSAGGKRWIRWRVRCRKNDAGSVEGFICYGIDVTEEHSKVNRLNMSRKGSGNL